MDWSHYALLSPVGQNPHAVAIPTGLQRGGALDPTAGITDRTATDAAAHFDQHNQIWDVTSNCFCVFGQRTQAPIYGQSYLYITDNTSLHT